MTTIAPKKPASSVDIDERMAEDAVSSLLLKVDSEPDYDRRAELEEELRVAYVHMRHVRTGTKGNSAWSILIFAAVVMAAIIMFIAAQMKKVFFYHHPENFLRITQNLDKEGYLFMVERVENGKVQDETQMEFCRDYRTGIEAGHTLSWIRFNQVGSCASVGPEDRGFDLVREDKPTFINGKWRKLPIIPPQCHFDWSTPDGHVVCEGGKARF